MECNSFRGGDDFLDVSVEVNWRSSSGNIRGPYWLGDKLFSVDVTSVPVSESRTEPLVSVVPVKINVGAILTSLLPYLFGSGGLVAVLFVALFKRKHRVSVSQVKRNMSRRKRH